jgi:hypothetical protein
MKKIIIIAAAITGVLLLTAMIIAPVSKQSSQITGKDQKPIPANVMKIAEKSCAGCHMEPGMKMAMGVLNLSAWDKYAAEKQAAKAKAMCKFVTKNKMPPKRTRTNNPDLVPTQDDVKIICDWAASLTAGK